jgi:hypothetical protein
MKANQMPPASRKATPLSHAMLHTTSLQRQQQVGVDVAACLLEVELGQRRVAGAGAGDQQVVDGRGQRVEEPLEPVEVGGVEGGDAGPELEADAVQAVGLRAVKIMSALGAGGPAS